MCDEYFKYLTIQNHFNVDFKKDISVADCTKTISKSVQEKSIEHQINTIDNLINAIQSLNRAEVLRLLSKDPKLVNVKNEKGQTGLIAAIQLASQTTNQQLENLIMFLLVKKSNIHRTDNHGKSALQYAIINENMNILETLLKYVSIDKDFVNQRSNPLHCAISHNKLNAVNLILTKFPNINLSLTDECGNSAFHTAIMNNNVNILEVLLQSAKEYDLKITNKKGLTPIFMAILDNNAKCVDILLKGKFGRIQSDSQLMSTGEGLIQFCEHHRNHQLTLKLLNYSEIPIFTEIDKHFGLTVLHWAIFRLNKTLIKELLKRQPKLVNVPDSKDWSPLAHLVQMYNIKKDSIDSILDIGLDLLLAGADIFSVKHKDIANALIQKILMEKIK